MINHNFWELLEYRICRELAGFSDNQLRFLWCDGLEPTEIVQDEHGQSIVGKAYVVGDRGQSSEDYTFRLTLAGARIGDPTIDWESLVPEESATEWLGVDRDRQMLSIHLSSPRNGAA
jgi:hypothetical protein